MVRRLRQACPISGWVQRRILSKAQDQWGQAPIPALRPFWGTGYTCLSASVSQS